MNNFICVVEYFPNCRGCDGGFYDSLKFFETCNDMLQFALENIDDYEIVDCYNIDGEKVGKFKYETSSHRCTGIFFEDEEVEMKTVDNGLGRLLWSIIKRKTYNYEG